MTSDNEVSPSLFVFILDDKPHEGPVNHQSNNPRDICKF